MNITPINSAASPVAAVVAVEQVEPVEPVEAVVAPQAPAMAQEPPGATMDTSQVTGPSTLSQLAADAVPRTTIPLPESAMSAQSASTSPLAAQAAGTTSNAWASAGTVASSAARSETSGALAAAPQALPIAEANRLDAATSGNALLALAAEMRPLSTSLQGPVRAGRDGSDAATAPTQEGAPLPTAIVPQQPALSRTIEAIAREETRRVRHDEPQQHRDETPEDVGTRPDHDDDDAATPSTPHAEPIAAAAWGYRQIAAMLARAGQHAALRELDFGRKVIVVQPDAQATRAHVLGLDRASIGRVDSLPARWHAASAADGWRHWRMHREQGLSLTYRTSSPSAEWRCLIRFGGQPTALHDPQTACLDIADAGRFARALGSQWSVLVVLAGREAA